MKYRDHRGSFTDSMNTVIHVNSLADIKNHLDKYYNFFRKSVNNLECRYYGFDKRNRWNTYIITFIVDDIRYVAGFSDGELK